MRSLIVALALLSLPSVGQAEEDRTRYVYLGGALSLGHCARLARLGGYQYAQFGGYVNGWYVWNACFGGVSRGGNNEPREKNEYRFHVRTDGETPLSTCRDDIEFEIPRIRCKEFRDDRDTLVCQIKTDRPREVKDDLEFVRCVRDVIGPVDRAVRVSEFAAEDN